MRLYEKEGKYFALIDNIHTELDKEVYRMFCRADNKGRTEARRNGKCSQSDFTKCCGDCFNCRWYMEGSNMFSYAYAFPGPDGQYSKSNALCPDVADPRCNVEDAAVTSVETDELLARMDKLHDSMPYGRKVLLMMLGGYSEKEIADHCGVSPQLMHYRVRKIREVARNILMK